jgi:hypothetical protein
MATSTLKLIIMIVLIAHGIGHVIPMLAAFGLKLSSSHSLHSWAFTNLIGEKPTTLLAVIYWLLPLIGFVVAALGMYDVLISYNSWRQVALISAILSMFGLVFFWNAFPFLIPNKVGVIVVNVLVFFYYNRIEL